MRADQPISFQAFGVQYRYTNLDELLAGADRLKTDAILLWNLRQVSAHGVERSIVMAEDRFRSVGAHFDVATKIIEADDEEMKRECAEIDRLLGDL